MFNPKQCVCNQEVLYFRSSKIEDFGSPIRVLPLSWVFMLENSSSIEHSQPMCVFWKMSWNPIQNNTNIILMEIVNHISKIFRCSITGSRCIISSHLISPRTIERILCNTHKFDMGVPHFFDVLRRFYCKLTIGIESIVISSRMTLP